MTMVNNTVLETLKIRKYAVCADKTSSSFYSLGMYFIHKTEKRKRLVGSKARQYTFHNKSRNENSLMSQMMSQIDCLTHSHTQKIYIFWDKVITIHAEQSASVTLLHHCVCAFPFSNSCCLLKYSNALYFKYE